MQTKDQDLGIKKEFNVSRNGEVDKKEFTSGFTFTCASLVSCSENNISSSSSVIMPSSRIPKVAYKVRYLIITEQNIRRLIDSYTRLPHDKGSVFLSSEGCKFEGN